jgi:hypothetical protein
VVVIRRGVWVGLGALAGVTATVWSRRRLAELSARAEAGELPAEMARLAGRGSRRLGRRLSTAVDTGRAEARRRREELRRSFEPRP